MDVEAFYSSFPHSDGIEACKNFMIEYGFHSMEFSNITKIIDFILTHKCLEFNDEFYIQTHGTVMGSKMAHHMQTYLCRTMKIIDNCTDKPFLYLRYIDDIFFAIW